MSKSKRLTSIVELSRTRERKAAKELAEYKDALAKQENRLNELLTYHEDYTRRFQTSGKNGIDSRQLHNYRVFLASLDATISLQRQKVDGALKELEEKNCQWLAIRSKHKALDKVMEGYRRQQSVNEERREQKESDERAQRPRDRSGDTDT